MRPFVAPMLAALVLALTACGSAPIDAPAMGDIGPDAAPADTLVDTTLVTDAPCGADCDPASVCVDDRCVPTDAGRPSDVTADATGVADGSDDLGDGLSADAADVVGCDAGRILVDGACVCATGLSTCRSGCSDLSRDPVNCGLCSHSCRGDEECRGGACVAAADAAAAPDACASTSDPSNCCGLECPLRINGIRTCVAGVCGFACTAGFADCNGAAADGCETGVTSSPDHCGACGVRCPSGRCTAGSCVSPCVVGCPAGLVCVDAGAACGPCEAPTVACGGACVNTQTDARNCGACGRVCPTVTGATIRCSAGACAVVACGVAHADCDADPSNGCETDITARSNCGRCGNACTGDLTCFGGTCSCGTIVAMMCGDRCARPGDPANCGRCGNACTDHEFCDALSGMCRSCGVNASGQPLTRCESGCRDLLDDSDNCGTCGNRCARGCFSGVCR